MLLCWQEGDGAWGCLWASARCGLSFQMPREEPRRVDVCVCRPAARARFIGAPRAWPSRGFPAPFSVLSALERGRLAGLRVGLRGSAVVEPLWQILSRG